MVQRTRYCLGLAGVLEPPYRGRAASRRFSLTYALLAAVLTLLGARFPSTWVSLYMLRYHRARYYGNCRGLEHSRISHTLADAHACSESSGTCHHHVAMMYRASHRVLQCIALACLVSLSICSRTAEQGQPRQRIDALLTLLLPPRCCRVKLHAPGGSAEPLTSRH